MKRVLPHPERESRPNLWRSLDELASSPDFAEKLERESRRARPNGTAAKFLAAISCNSWAARWRWPASV
jgi:MoCo/4Fe-4S cofactor protein with predicted Tat translocation signal